jgi:hypothetical protein
MRPATGDKKEAHIIYQLAACIRAQVSSADAMNRTLRTVLCVPDQASASECDAPTIKGMIARVRRVSWNNERMIEQLARVTVHDQSRAHWLHEQAGGVSLHWCTACNQHLCASCASICAVVHDAQLGGR